MSARAVLVLAALVAAAAETTQLLRVPVPQPSEQTLVLIQDLLARDDTAAASGNYLALQLEFWRWSKRSGAQGFNNSLRVEILRHRYEPVDVQDSGIGFPPESTPRAACCDIQALDSGIPGCARLGDLILDQESVDSVWKRTITFQQDQETENSLVLDEKFAPKTSTGSVSLYSVAIYNCESPGQAFFVSGKVEFVNHYRRLPLQYQRLEKVTLIISLLRANSVKLKNLFKFQKVMLIFYAAITILWTIFLFKSRRDRLHIHIIITGVCVLNFVYFLASFWFFRSYDTYGRPNALIFFMRTLLNSMRCSISYASALVLASGVDSSLRDFWSCHKLVSQWAIACFFAQLIYETGSYFSRNFPPQDIVLMFMIPLALIFSIFPYWFSLIVFRTIYDLENRQQAVKLTVYRIFAYVVISASTLAYIAQFARLVLFIVWTNPFFSQNFWLLDIATYQLIYSVVLIIIMLLWNPKSNGRVYFSAEQIANSDDEHELVALDLDDQSVFPRQSSDAQLSRPSPEYKSSDINRRIT